MIERVAHRFASGSSNMFRGGVGTGCCMCEMRGTTSQDSHSAIHQIGKPKLGSHPNPQSQSSPCGSWIFRRNRSSSPAHWPPARPETDLAWPPAAHAAAAGRRWMPSSAVCSARLGNGLFKRITAGTQLVSIPWPKPFRFPHHASRVITSFVFQAQNSQLNYHQNPNRSSPRPDVTYTNNLLAQVLGK